jgi:hypothetical protein
VDAGSEPNNLFTPALTSQLLQCCVNYTETGIEVRGGPRNGAIVSRDISHLVTNGFPPFESAASAVIDKADRALKPEAIALGVFGGIVGLAALLIVGQIIGRQFRLAEDEREVLRALGGGPATTSGDGLIGVIGAVVVGGLFAVIVAVALSPLAPLGPVRPVYPDSGVAFDWTVLGFGILGLVVLLGSAAVLISIWNAPHRIAQRTDWKLSRSSRIVGLAGSVGLPTPAATGMRFALESGQGRAAVPVRSAILGASIAVMAVIATVTFGASLNSLVSHPALYGWNWDYALAAGGDVPQGTATTLLRDDHYVAQWSGVYTANLTIDGQSLPVLGERPGASVAPPVLSGQGLEGADQVVLGATTMAQLHKHLGQTVEVTSGLLAPAHLRIVGTAVMPVIGSTGGPHLEMGTGAILSYRLIPPVDRNPFNDPLPGPNAILVRLRPGLNRAKAVESLREIASKTSNTANFGVAVTSVLLPAEIANYRSLGATPVYLAAGLAAGSMAALALTLIASVRRRRRDLALLKTLGFTGRQLASTVAWQSTIAVGIGTVVGVPLGIALGRGLWDLFAHDIHAVPAPTVPALTVALIAVGTLVLANVVAALPGRIAARTPTALLLRAE